MIDESTDRYHLPLPSAGNTLAQDVPRLRAALRLVDAALKSVADGSSGDVAALLSLLSGHIGAANAHTPTQIGLGNVDNTSDLDKPISSKTLQALAGKQAVLAPGENIKNINGAPILGAGSIALATPSDTDALLNINPTAKASAYTLTLADRGRSIDTSASVTIPANASTPFPLGSTIMVTNVSDSAISIDISADTLRLAGTAATGARALAAWGVCTLRKVAPTTWYAIGAGLS